MVFQLFTALIFILLGLINGLMPFYSRRGTPFGVTVPSEHQEHTFIQQRKKNFFIQHMLISLLFSLPVFFIGGIDNLSAREMWSSIYLIAATFTYLILSFGLYLYYRKAIRSWKKENAIATDIKKERIVVDTLYHQDLKVFSTRIIVIVQLAIVVLSTAVIILFYDAVPGEFPIHWNSQNIADRVVEKSWLSVLMLPLIQLLMVPVLAFSHYSFVKAKQKLLSSYPQLTSKNSKKFRRAWSVYFLVVSIAVQLLLTVTNFYSLFFWDDIGMEWLSVFIGLFVFGVIGYSLFLTWKYGQGGEKLVYAEITDSRAKTTEVDEDAFWKLGIFYYNPEDPAVFVEKRFGIGTTLNFARWQSWAAMFGLCLFIVLISLFGSILD